MYTTLQPCAQCAGMMTLAQVRCAVFLQADPGMYLVDVLMRALSPDTLRAPMPLPASMFGMDTYRALNEAYTDYWTSNGHVWLAPNSVEPRGRRDLTAFLCTAPAYAAFRGLASRFDALAEDARDNPAVDGSGALIDELREFVAYASSTGVQRGAALRV